MESVKTRRKAVQSTCFIMSEDLQFRTLCVAVPIESSAVDALMEVDGLVEHAEIKIEKKTAPTSSLAT